MERKDERKEGMRRSPPQKKQIKKMRAERECFKSVGSTQAAPFNLNLRRRRFHSKVPPLTPRPDGGNSINYFTAVKWRMIK